MAEIVECLSDFTYPMRPIALTWQGRRLEISGTLSEWRTPAARHFRVSTADGLNFELIYNESPDAIPGSLWQVHPIQE